jgi:hypothetical protein
MAKPTATADSSTQTATKKSSATIKPGGSKKINMNDKRSGMTFFFFGSGVKPQK